MLHNPAIRVCDSATQGLAIVLLEPMPFTIYGQRFIIPAGYVSDGASVPRFFWRLLSPQIDPVTLAPSIAHDWLYDNAARLGLDRADCDSWYATRSRGMAIPSGNVC